MTTQHEAPPEISEHPRAPFVASCPAHMEAGRTTLNLSLWVSVAIGLALIGGGIFLVWLGAQGDTEIYLFGNTFRSQNVGVVGIFCGAVLVTLNVRRALRSLERLGALPRA
jgi:hypothetical protein